MKNSLRILAFICLFASGMAWAGDRSIFPLSKPYDKALKANTKQGNYYSLEDLSSHLMWKATFISDAFRTAFDHRYDEIYPYGQDFLAQKKAALWSTPNPEAEFFIALYAKHKEMKEVGNEKALWDLSLETEGKTYKPSKVEPIDIGQFERRFFSYVHVWHKGYRVVFPVTGLNGRTQPFRLHLTSVDGQSSLKFN